jgi:hypothetical protein
MDIQIFTKFFMWCSIINGALLILSALLLTFMQDFIYSLHGKLFPLPRETFRVIIYSFLGGYKILFIVFNLVPYVALVILG